MPMQLDELMRAISSLSARGDSDKGEGDYRDFLTQYMNSINQYGADEGDASMMLNELSPDRRQAMTEYGGGPAVEMDPFIQQARNSLNDLLRRK